VTETFVVRFPTLSVAASKCIAGPISVRQVKQTLPLLIQAYHDQHRPIAQAAQPLAKSATPKISSTAQFDMSAEKV
jgi:hypothetical protein